MATSHIDDGDLDLYALDRLADTAPVEEHLLVCEDCRARLAEWDAYVRAIRAAAGTINASRLNRYKQGDGNSPALTAVATRFSLRPFTPSLAMVGPLVDNVNGLYYPHV